MEQLYEIKFLLPKDIQFSRMDGGLLSATIDGELYEEVIIYQTFPFSHENKFISIRTSEDEEIGILMEMTGLDEISKNELEEEIRLRYLIPKVERVKRIKQEPGLWVFDLVTDRGELRMLMRNLHEHVKVESRGRMLLTDIDGLRCEIPNRNNLDFNSIKELTKIM